MPYGHLTKYQLSARVRALRAEHRHLAGRAGSLPRLREIRGELTRLLAAQSTQRAVALLSRALAAEGAPTGASLLVGQFYIFGRIILRTQFAASQIALFQGRLAHAGYTAAPVPVWPDSAAAEAIRPH